MRPCRQVPLWVQAAFNPADNSRPVKIILKVILPGPDHLDRFAEGLGQLKGFNNHHGFSASAESAAAVCRKNISFFLPVY